MNVTTLSNEWAVSVHGGLTANLAKAFRIPDITSPAKGLRKKYHGKKAARCQRQSRQYVVAAFVRQDHAAKARYNKLFVQASSHLNRATSGE